MKWRTFSHARAPAQAVETPLALSALHLDQCLLVQARPLHLPNSLCLRDETELLLSFFNHLSSLPSFCHFSTPPSALLLGFFVGGRVRSFWCQCGAVVTESSRWLLPYNLVDKAVTVIIMSTKLLNCLICPKRPDFSDISHLLTHVSSKGHLSHLHKLQVRSHQEIAAGHQLALYNQWYQEHDMGQLLSERMQQKDGKVVAKRETRVKSEGTSTRAPVYSSNNVFENPVPVKTLRNIKPAPRGFKHEPTDDDGEYTSSPIKRNRYDQTLAIFFAA